MLSLRRSWIFRKNCTFAERPVEQVAAAIGANLVELVAQFAQKVHSIEQMKAPWTSAGRLRPHFSQSVAFQACSFLSVQKKSVGYAVAARTARRRSCRRRARPARHRRLRPSADQRFGARRADHKAPASVQLGSPSASPPGHARRRAACRRRNGHSSKLRHRIELVQQFARGLAAATSSASTCSAASVPSPVVAWSDRITCPDCSPPTLKPPSFMRSSTCGRRPSSARAAAPRLQEALEAKVRHHRRNDTARFQPPLPRPARADQPIIWSPSTIAPFSSTTISGQRRRRAQSRYRRRSQPRFPAKVRARSIPFVVDIYPFGVTPIAMTSAPSSQNTVGALYTPRHWRNRARCAAARDAPIGQALLHRMDYNDRARRRPLCASDVCRIRELRRDGEQMPSAPHPRRQFISVGTEQLDAIVIIGVMARRQHDAQIGAHRARQHRDRRGRHRADLHHVHANTGKASDQRFRAYSPTNACPCRSRRDACDRRAGSVRPRHADAHRDLRRHRD